MIKYIKLVLFILVSFSTSANDGDDTLDISSNINFDNFNISHLHKPKSKFDIGANVFMIDVPIVIEGYVPDIIRVPLYGLTIGMGSKTINIKSGISNDIYVDYNLNKDIRLSFMSNPMYISFGFILKGDLSKITKNWINK